VRIKSGVMNEDRRARMNCERKPEVKKGCSSTSDRERDTAAGLAFRVLERERERAHFKRRTLPRRPVSLEHAQFDHLFKR
jgi:hypothetical protein